MSITKTKSSVKPKKKNIEEVEYVQGKTMRFRVMKKGKGKSLTNKQLVKELAGTVKDLPADMSVTKGKQ
jgi:argininosuccinate lyase